MKVYKKQNKNFCINKGPFYNHFIHLTGFGIIWLIASLLDSFQRHNISIMVLFLGVSLYKPIFKLIRRSLSLCPVSQEDPLYMMITCMTLGVPIGIFFCFLPFIHNMNIFFPAFGIMFGVVFGLMAYVYKLINYTVLSLTLIAGCLYIALNFDEFALGGYFVSFTLLSFGLINRLIGAISFSFLSSRKSASLGLIEGQKAA